MTIDAAIVDFTAALLLRYFRTGEKIEGGAVRLDHRRDLEILKGHWSVSGAVRSLVKYVLAHPHEAQSLLSFRERIDDAVARGRIDARRTWQYRLQTGLPSALVTAEPVRSFNTGPNLVLAWVIGEAAAYTSHLSIWQGEQSPYVAVIEEAQREMRGVQRIEALREPLRAVALGQRPSAGAVLATARARPRIYRLAFEAYGLLQGLERGDPAAIEVVARSALIAPLEDWRRFELAVGLAVGEAVGRVANAPLHLHLLAGDSAAPIVTAGRFAVYWQQRTGLYTVPPLEESEQKTRDVLAAFGLSIGADRPDFVVVDSEAGAVVSVIEVKYIAGDTTLGRFREAVGQIVRYARGYAPVGQTGGIIAQSLVALSREAPKKIDAAATVPGSVDFDGIRSNELDAWAQRFAVPAP
jgi:hypothetical protein